jgi:hypothetical protein
LTKLTAIVEVYEYVPPQVVVYFRKTVVPPSEISLDDIVTEVGLTAVSQARELADVKVPDKVLL